MYLSPWNADPIYSFVEHIFIEQMLHTKQSKVIMLWTFCNLNLAAHICVNVAGGRHATALTVDGKVFSWGEGDDGKLGHFSRM